MAQFKKFIETGGKSLSEIKKNIGEMLSGAVGSIVDDVDILPKDLRKKLKDSVRDIAERGGYQAEKIPPKKNVKYGDITKDEPQQLPFPNPIAYPKEAVPEHLNPQDEFMLDKIREMRSLEDITRSSYIARRSALITLLRQGEFMKDVEDDYERRVYCAVQRPVYAAMSNSQLRTYFTWRTDIRRGIYRDIEKPYVLLYCYELLNKIGVDSSKEAYERLVSLWENVRAGAKYADEILPRWIKDFYAFNRVDALLPESLISGGINAAVAGIENGDFESKLDFLAETT